MGSDSGQKAARYRDRPSWCLALVCVCVVVPLLLLKRHIEVNPPTEDPPRTTTYLRRAPQKPPPESSSSPSPPSPPCQETALRRRVRQIASMSNPDEALVWIDSDPLGVDAVRNASEWRCPLREEDRLLPPEGCRGPSVDAERRLRSGTGALWFEHLSKAGGTSFCKFARQNVGVRRTPSYFCMPSDGAKIPGTDGRVGRWTARQISGYLARTKHLVLANEWDAFPARELEVLQNASSHHISTTTTEDKPPGGFVLTTVVRDPLDRLVSAYKFWGITHNPSAQKPQIATWLDNRDKSARRRPHRKFPDDFLSQVARNNFAVWKFASHTDPRFDDCAADATCDVDALDVALTNLETFHVAVPTTWQSAAGPLYRRLGWTHLNEIHVVPSGSTHNSEAKADLDPALYRKLRRSNVLDLLLFAWVKRAFLERLHCPRTPV